MQPVKTDNGRYRKYGYKLGVWYHNGHDYDCNLHEPVFSVAPGVVLYSSRNVNGFGGYDPSLPGGCVIIQHQGHEGGFIGLYGHVDSDLVLNEKVERGERIGRVHQYTSSGLKLPHLHFAISTESWAVVQVSKWGYVDSLEKYGWTDPQKYLSICC
jgi:murein DD-endopeptidase MepM/ murein hydrolase activator NlpD